jgi:hypothetical protein
MLPMAALRIAASRSVDAPTVPGIEVIDPLNLAMELFTAELFPFLAYYSL